MNQETLINKLAKAGIPGKTEWNGHICFNHPNFVLDLCYTQLSVEVSGCIFFLDIEEIGDIYKAGMVYAYQSKVIPALHISGPGMEVICLLPLGGA
ncbi:MAG: hypothetical protein O0W93_01315 [Methanocorpusculum sp.]|nr:hypothetical protein [Methanocorpusculum sp.]